MSAFCTGEGWFHFIMRQHQPGQTGKGGRPMWLENAYAEARRCASSLAGSHIENAREEMKGGQIAAIVVETRLDLTFPSALKARGVTGVFIKLNIRHIIESEMIVQSVPAGRSLVVVYGDGKITGLPLTKAQAKKLHKGYRHFVIRYEPDEMRKMRNAHLGPESSFDEEGFWIGWYTPKGGHRHADEKGGELVAEFRSELFVLQFLYENSLVALYEIEPLVEWGFLPVNDRRRDDEEYAYHNGGMTPDGKIIKDPRIHPAQSYHSRRLWLYFEELFRDSAVDDEELHKKVNAAMADTVIGKPRTPVPA